MLRCVCGFLKRRPGPTVLACGVAFQDDAPPGFPNLQLEESANRHTLPEKLSVACLTRKRRNASLAPLLQRGVAARAGEWPVLGAASVHTRIAVIALSSVR